VSSVGRATFAELLTQHRTARGMSQQDLAAATSVSVRAIGDLERGATRRPQGASVLALADGLGLDATARVAFVQAARQTPPASTTRAIRSVLLGRDADLDGIVALLAAPLTRLVTVTGPIGVGKSALARQAADRLRARFDAIEFVGSTVNAADVGTAVPCQPSTLLVIDDFTHAERAALVLSGLLAGHPRLRILATARSPIRIRGEHVWPLRPLPLEVAVAYLAERAVQIRAGFDSRDPLNSPIASVCRRLAGMPRAIELAAARLRMLDLPELDGELAALDLDAEFARLEPEGVVRRMIAAAIGRLPARAAAVLATLAARPGGTAPATLRRMVPDDDLDASVMALIASGLVTVEDRAGRAHLVAVQPVAEVLAVQR
jgi:transcriptional regulator with XRE-family HTH domain